MNDYPSVADQDWIRILLGVSGLGSGSKKAKITPKKYNNLMTRTCIEQLDVLSEIWRLWRTWKEYMSIFTQK
jgi:hypothetical protein